MIPRQVEILAHETLARVAASRDEIDEMRRTIPSIVRHIQQSLEHLRAIQAVLDRRGFRERI